MKKPALKQRAAKTLRTLADLTTDRKNANKHTERGVGMLEYSLRTYGAGRSILVDRDGHVIAGNATLERAAELGLGVEVVKTRGDKLVVVQREDLDLNDPKARELAIADNRVAQVDLAWDADTLKGLQDDGVDLSQFFLKDELAGILAADVTPSEGRTDPDDVPAERATSIKAGDLFELGKHRLLCGDCAKAEDVALLMGDARPAVVITDPPYNVGFDYGESVDDEKTGAAYVEWSRGWFGLARALSESCVVLTSGIINMPMWIADIERTHRIIAWVKENQCSRNDIGTTSGFNIWEPVLVFGKAKKCVARDSFSIPIGMQADAAIKAWSWLIENFSESGDLLYEPFSGSGTTMIGCETLSRRCFGVEVEPKYVQLAVDRWQNFTGLKAVKVG
ncbi:MAG: DNA modification methylase [Acidobacteria bacterium]|nr:DNA modification methylase [Acidobacteriota bacterium]